MAFFKYQIKYGKEVLASDVFYAISKEKAKTCAATIQSIFGTRKNPKAWEIKIWHMDRSGYDLEPQYSEIDFSKSRAYSDNEKLLDILQHFFYNNEI